MKHVSSVLKKNRGGNGRCSGGRPEWQPEQKCTECMKGMIWIFTETRQIIVACCARTIAAAKVSMLRPRHLRLWRAKLTASASKSH